MCFQAGTEAANIRRGAAAEIQQAEERFASSGAGGTPVTGSGAAALLANLTAECGAVAYEADCFAGRGAGRHRSQFDVNGRTGTGWSQTSGGHGSEPRTGRAHW